MKLSDQERQLYAELVTFIALELANPYEWFEAEKSDKGIVEVRRLLDFGVGERFGECFDAPEGPCSILARLGVAKEIWDNPHQRKGFGGFEMTMNVDCVAQFVEDTLSSKHPSLAEVIAEFVYLGAMRNRVSEGRIAFVPDPEYGKVMDLLSDAGYAEKSEGGYVWTDKTVESMQKAFYWVEDDPPPD